MLIQIANLDDVGRLVLPWDIGLRRPTVRELADDRTHPALHLRHDDHNGWTHEGRIAYYVERPEEIVELWLPAWRLGDSLQLRDGNHRACALYRLRPSQWKLLLDL